MSGRDYGRSFGPLYWRYHLTSAVEFLKVAGQELRWYGVSIPWTRYGFGIIVKRRAPEKGEARLRRRPQDGEFQPLTEEMRKQLRRAYKA